SSHASGGRPWARRDPTEARNCASGPFGGNRHRARPGLRGGGVRTCVRVPVIACEATTHRCVDPARRPRLLLRVGRAARRSAGAPIEIAARLRTAVREEVGLPITVGVARTKFLAKVASGIAKPDGLLLVEPAREREFLHPLPVERLWGVGRVTAAKLHDRGI